MATKRISLNELRTLVKQIIKEETNHSEMESIGDYIDRIGKNNLPKPKYKIGDTVLIDMGDGTKEKLTISGVSYFKPPKSKFTYAYRTKEYSNEEGMRHLEDDIIKKI
jgi:hypothetical protein